MSAPWRLGQVYLVCLFLSSTHQGPGHSAGNKGQANSAACVRAARGRSEPGRNLPPSLGFCQQQRFFQIGFLKILGQRFPETFKTLQDTQKKSFWGLWEYRVCDFTSLLRVHRPLAKMPSSSSNLFREKPTKQTAK